MARPSETEMDQVAGKIFAGMPTAEHAVRTAGHIQLTALRSALKYQMEMLSFFSQRCERDLALIENLSASGASADAFDVCAGFWQNALADYSREAGRLAEIGSGLAADTTTEIMRETDAVGKDMAAGVVV